MGLARRSMANCCYKTSIHLPLQKFKRWVSFFWIMHIQYIKCSNDIWNGFPKISEPWNLLIFHCDNYSFSSCKWLTWKIRQNSEVFWQKCNYNSYQKHLVTISGLPPLDKNHLEFSFKTTLYDFSIVEVFFFFYFKNYCMWDTSRH